MARAPGALRRRGLAAALAGRPGFTDAGDLELPAPRARRGPSGLLAAGGCAGWSVCIYNPDLDPDRRGADDIIGYLTDALR